MTDQAIPTHAPVTHKRTSIFNKMPLAAKFGIFIIVFNIFVALFAPLLAPYSPTETFAEAMSTWNSAHFLGTDQLGRDVLSRLIYGLRNSLTIVVATTVLTFSIGAVLGILAAIRGGWVDQILSRIVDILLAVPALIFALMLLSIFGTSVLNLILIIALLDCTRVFRVVRAVAANVAVMDYVQVAHLRGEGWIWVMRKEILPNIAPALAAEFGIRFCYVFLTVAALSFLGVGIQPPTPDLGSMVRDTAGFIAYASYSYQIALMPLIPAIVIAFLTVSVNLVVDWVLQISSGVRDDH